MRNQISTIFIVSWDVEKIYNNFVSNSVDKAVWIVIEKVS